MHKLLSLAVIALLTFGFSPAQAGDSTPGKQKVVYHINFNDVAQLKAALGNVQNHIAAVGEDKIEIKVVMHGNGVDLLKLAKTNPELQSKVMNLKQQDVAFEVCNNTLKGRHINYKTDLFDVSEKDIVPSGVAEIASLQQKGYVYIKP